MNVARRCISALVLLAAVSPMTSADTYYIDPSAAQDGDGTERRPFNTWESVTWSAGNRYLQRRGTEYHQTIEVDANGRPDARIVLGAYGTGPKPKVRVAGPPDLQHIERSSENGILLSKRSYVTVRDFQISTTGDAEAIYGMHGSHNRLEHLDIGPTGGHGAWILFQTDLTVRNCRFHHAGTLGPLEKNWKSADNIHLESCHDYLVEFCESHDCHQGAEFDASDGGARYTTGTWRYNTAYDTSVHTGWSCYKMSGHHPRSSVLLLYNLAHHSGRGPGLALQEELSATAIGNTIYRCAYGIQQKHTESIIHNNIVVGGSYGMLVEDEDFPHRCDHNLWFDNDCLVQIEGGRKLNLDEWRTIRGGTYGANSFEADPLFRDPTAGDFTLLPGSPALGRGANLGAQFRRGLSPSSRWPDDVKLLSQHDGANWDIGAFVYP